MKLIKKREAFLSKLKMWLYGVSATCFAHPILAEDKVVTEFKNKYKGDYLVALRSYIGEGGRVLLLGISVLGFIWVAYAALAKFNECRINKAEWAELAVLVIIAAGLLVFITLLLAQGQSITDAVAPVNEGKGAASLWGHPIK